MIINSLSITSAEIAFVSIFVLYYYKNIKIEWNYILCDLIYFKVLIIIFN
jgi:hypothetical protein